MLCYHANKLFFYFDIFIASKIFIFSSIFKSFRMIFLKVNYDFSILRNFKGSFNIMTFLVRISRFRDLNYIQNLKIIRLRYMICGNCVEMQDGKIKTTKKKEKFK